MPKLLQETSAEVCDDDKEFSRRQDIAERNRYKTRYPCMDEHDDIYFVYYDIHTSQNVYWIFRF